MTATAARLAPGILARVRAALAARRLTRATYAVDHLAEEFLRSVRTEGDQ